MFSKMSFPCSLKEIVFKILFNLSNSFEVAILFIISGINNSSKSLESLESSVFYASI